MGKFLRLRVLKSSICDILTRNLSLSRWETSADSANRTAIQLRGLRENSGTKFEMVQDDENDFSVTARFPSNRYKTPLIPALRLFHRSEHPKFNLHRATWSCSHGVSLGAKKESTPASVDLSKFPRGYICAQVLRGTVGPVSWGYPILPLQRCIHPLSK